MTFQDRPVPLGLTAAQATAYAALHTANDTAIAAHDPIVWSKSSVAAVSNRWPDARSGSGIKFGIKFG